MKTVFITGASTGIGLATAKLFYAKGWNVVATMRSPEKDTILSFETIEPALFKGVKRFGQINVLINNAAYGLYGVFEAIPRESVKAQFDVNVFGTMDVTRAVLPHLRANSNGGGVINISSGSGFFGLPLMTMYSASKHALEGFTEALSYELASQNIFVKSVVPHDGVASTSFGNRSQSDAVLGEGVYPPSYEEFVQNCLKKFSSMEGAIEMSSEDVAELIYESATDGKKQLRYFIGPDHLGTMKAKYESSTDEQYMEYMRTKVFDV
ncbi:short-chain dehydrogenase reductase SDR [Hymenopellis radicata]|nr:short-chain dehydrogenase reductase SDR [Hymenopellis radicata]